MPATRPDISRDVLSIEPSANSPILKRSQELKREMVFLADNLSKVSTA
jgi:hypothetical protein